MLFFYPKKKGQMTKNGKGQGRSSADEWEIPDAKGYHEWRAEQLSFFQSDEGGEGKDKGDEARHTSADRAGETVVVVGLPIDLGIQLTAVCFLCDVETEVRDAIGNPDFELLALIIRKGGQHDALFLRK